MDQSGLMTRAAHGLGAMLQSIGSRLRPTASNSLLSSTPVTQNVSGEWITERNVLTVPAAWAAVNAVTTDVASLPLRLKRRLDGGASEVVRKHPAARLFARSPDGGSTTPSQFLQAWIMHRLITGDSYARVYWQSGWPVRLKVLDPNMVQVLEDSATGDLYYQVQGESTPLTKGEVLHLAGLGGDGITGYSPTKLGAQTLGISKAAETHAASFLGNSAIACGIVGVPSAGNPEKNAALLKRMQDEFSGPNKHRLYVAPPGTTWTQTSADPQKAQLVEVREFQILEASRIWRVPPDKLGDYSKSSYASVEQSHLAYLTETLRPLCESIESVLNLVLLLDDEVDEGLHFAFDFTDYLRADTATRSVWIRNMSASGLVKIDEGRALEGLPPLPDGQGDKLMVPLNTAPLDQIIADAVASQTSPSPSPSNSTPTPEAVHG